MSVQYFHHLKLGNIQANIPRWYFPIFKFSRKCTEILYFFPKADSFNWSEVCSKVSKWIERRWDFGSQLTTFDVIGIWQTSRPRVNNSLNLTLKKMLRYLSLDIICSSKIKVFLELRSRKALRFSEQIMPANKYPSIFSRQMKARNLKYKNAKSIFYIRFFGR